MKLLFEFLVMTMRKGICSAEALLRPKAGSLRLPSAAKAGVPLHRFRHD